MNSFSAINVFIMTQLFLLFGCFHSRPEENLVCNLDLKEGSLTTTLAACTMLPESKSNELWKKNLRKTLSEFVIKSKNFTSIYYLNLQNGLSVSLNTKKYYHSASLSKIPMMMSYLKHAESFPNILYRTLRYRPESDDYSVLYPPRNRLTPNQLYDVQSLIKRMVTESDNPSKRMLIENILMNIKKFNPEFSPSVNAYSDLFNKLKLPSPDTNPEALMTVKEIAHFFKSLFFRTYLSENLSELALEMLSNSTFKLGMRKYIKSDIAMARKFGEYIDLKSNRRELHECGITYAESSPYILCIMSQGPEESNIEENIAQISKIVFERVSAQKKAPK